MHARPISLLLPLAVLLLVPLVGCRTQTKDVTAALLPAAVSSLPDAAAHYVELLYPQSDDQGHYVGLSESSEVTVSGIVAAPETPRGIVVNGVSVQPYPVQDLAPFNTPAGYSTYGFSVPTTVKPDTLLSVALDLLGVTSPAVSFAPDKDAVYTRLLELAGLSPEVPLAQYRLGNALLSAEDYEDAVAAYTRSITLEPEFVWGYDGLGQAYVLMQRPADAVVQFGKAKKLRPKWADPHYRLAQIYTSQKRFDDAIAEYREALRYAPAHPGLHRGYAVALYNRGHYEEAWNQVHRARERGTKPPDDFVKSLRQRMPEPSKDDKARDRVEEQERREPERQDGLRKPGPHASGQVDKPRQSKDDGDRGTGPRTKGKADRNQSRQDGARAPGPHASGQTGKRSKKD